MANGDYYTWSKEALAERITTLEAELAASETARRIAQGVMDDEHDTYPRFCECCPAEFAGSTEAAERAGWRVGFDGWICKKCNSKVPNAPGKPTAANEPNEG